MASPVADWLVWLDADDVFLGGRLLRPLLEQIPPSFNCVHVPYYANFYGRQMVYIQARYLRADARWRWLGGPVHEFPSRAGRVAPFVIRARGGAEGICMVHQRIEWRSSTARNLRLLRGRGSRDPIDQRAAELLHVTAEDVATIQHAHVPPGDANELAARTAAGLDLASMTLDEFHSLVPRGQF